MLKKWVISLLILLSTSIIHGAAEGQLVAETQTEKDHRVKHELPLVQELYNWFMRNGDKATSETIVMAGNTQFNIDGVVTTPGIQRYDCQKYNAKCTHRNIQVMLHQKGASEDEYWSLQGNFGAKAISDSWQCWPSHSLLTSKSQFKSERPLRVSNNFHWRLMDIKPNDEGVLDPVTIDGKEYEHLEYIPQEKGVKNGHYKLKRKCRLLQRFEDVVKGEDIERTPFTIILQESTAMYENQFAVDEETASVKRITFVKSAKEERGTAKLVQKEKPQSQKSQIPGLFITTVAALGVGCKMWSMYQQNK